MGRYNFVSSGAAAGNGVAEVLSQQREEARRTMLDEITRQNAEQQRLASQANIRSTDATTAQNQVETENLLMDRATKGLLQGDPMDTSTMDTKTLDLLRKNNRVKDTQATPEIPANNSFQDTQALTPVGQTTPATPAKTTYLGGQADRERSRKIEDIGKLVAQLKDPNLSAVERAGLGLQAEAMGLGGVGMTGFFNATQPRQKVGFFDPVKREMIFPNDPSTGKPMEGGPGDNAIHTLPYPPKPNQVPAWMQQSLFQVPDPENPGQFISHWLRPGEQPSEANRIHGNLRKGNEPAPVKNSGSRVPASQMNQLNILRGKSASKPGMIYGTNAADPKDVEAYHQAQDGVISSYQTSGDVKDTIRQILGDPGYQKMSTQQIIDYYKGDFKPNEFEQFADLLSVARGS